MPDYSIIADCTFTPGSRECFDIMWTEYGVWTPCQCCQWWDDYCAMEFTADEGDYDNLEVVDTNDTFYNTFVKMLGLDGPR